MPSEAAAFESFVARVRGPLERGLASWLEARISEASRRGADVEVVADAVRQLVLRGGKRMRAVLLAAAYEACGGDGGADAVLMAGASLELLQAYLLVHDDWMDGDEERRGGPSVPAMMRARWMAHADAASILAGDLACAWAQKALLEVPLAPALVLAAARELAHMQDEVIAGQVLDVRGAAATAREVESVHVLKTASYSVRGPVLVGARLAGSGEPQVAALAAYAEPLGVAFQMRDDVLGVFGDARAMGKPAGTDLREGKRTALVVEAMRDARAAERLQRVLGRADAGDDAVAAALGAIEACGARARVEERIAALVHDARAALDRAELTPAGRGVLAHAIVALTERNA
jgi:geranylgeranyl diphosphate synthase type I